MPIGTPNPEAYGEECARSRQPPRCVDRPGCPDAKPHIRLGIAAVAVLLLLSFPTAGKCQSSGEYRLKLAFLYNFAQFVEWPPDAFPDSRSPLDICVAGENPFRGDIQDSLNGRTVRGHPLKLRTLNPDENLEGCQMIFVRASEKSSTSKILTSAKGSDILTVGEAKGFAHNGGMINLTRDDNRLRFEVNLTAASQSRLRISSKLLALATIVKD
jgi:hypothetical protein